VRVIRDRAGRVVLRECDRQGKSCRFNPGLALQELQTPSITWIGGVEAAADGR